MIKVCTKGLILGTNLEDLLVVCAATKHTITKTTKHFIFSLIETDYLGPIYNVQDIPI